MKYTKPNISRISILVFQLIFLKALLISCSSGDLSDSPYQKNNSYNFKVDVILKNDTIETDTISMTVRGKGITGRLLGLNMVDWSTKGVSNYKERRGINISKDQIRLQMPLKLEYLEYENIAIAGYPSHSKTTKPGYTIESTHKLSNHYGSLSKVTIKHFSIIEDSLLVSYKNESLFCKVSSGENKTLINEYGKYTNKTYFHPLYGFIKIKYNYPNGKKIVFRLI